MNDYWAYALYLPRHGHSYSGLLDSWGAVAALNHTPRHRAEVSA